MLHIMGAARAWALIVSWPSWACPPVQAWWGLQHGAHAASPPQKEPLPGANADWFRAYFPDLRAGGTKRLMDYVLQHPEGRLPSADERSSRSAAQPPARAGDAAAACQPRGFCWLVNGSSGCVHPSLDGVTPTCGHRLRSAQVLNYMRAVGNRFLFASPSVSVHGSF